MLTIGVNRIDKLAMFELDVSALVFQYVAYKAYPPLFVLSLVTLLSPTGSTILMYGVVSGSSKTGIISH